ncbi:MAG: DUF1080 domain-containing protein [Betaproteobacteria bacterium]|nr:MAG: DUF1080 domain-containing protein [Betaproteobacteria bacterium]
MRRTAVQCLAAVAIAVSLNGCGTMGYGDAGWTTLIDGAQGLDNFTRAGEANWSAGDGVIQASQGGKELGYLVSKQSYKDFTVRVEFWASDDANSGVFLRCQERTKITDQNCYEANIFDQRPDPTYGTGAIVRVAAQGAHLVLVLNGQKTVDVQDGKLAEGPIALQWGQGTIKFRKVQVKPL